MRFVPSALAVLCCAPAFAQTTWTSFEGRRGHAIASDPTGGMLMFGGESSISAGEYLDDTNTFTISGSTANWTQLSPLLRPTARTEHAMASGVGTDDTAIFILFSGLAEPSGGGTAVPSDETFVYNGGWGNGVIYAVGPSARTGHAMVSDTRRNRIMLFGGFSGGFAVNDLWEFDPVNMVWLQPAVNGNTPPSRYDHATAYHPGNGLNDGRVYVFGGTPFRDDMWELQYAAGTATYSWTNVTPPTRPTGRRRAAMSYLPAFDNIVLFGGEDNTLTPLGDTWTWDRNTSTWSQQSPTNSPPARFDHAMAADQLGNLIVLLGGTDGGGQPLTETWLWNGVDWTDLSPPPARTGVAMAYDENRDRHVVFGGRSVPGGADLAETWERISVGWSQATPTNAPSARSDAGVAYDSARQRTVLFGGRAGGPCGTELGDTWEWDGQDWQQMSPASSPPTAGGVQPVFDSKRNRTWMLVGAQMWSWDGTDWMLNQVAWPGSRSKSHACFDSARGRNVLFGGSAGGNPGNNVLGDTWEWDGQQWHAMAPPAPTPDARELGAMAFDSVRQETILICGYDGSNIGDTWLWDGITWSEPSGSAGTIRGITMAFDPVRGRAVTFGGLRNNGNTEDKHTEWDGQQWFNINVSNRPGTRWQHSMAFDPIANRIVLFGGAVTNNLQGAHNSDTWTFDGTTWTDVTPATGPAARRAASMAYDSRTGMVLLTCGSEDDNSPNYFDDTWLWDGTNWLTTSPGLRPSARDAGVLLTTPTQTWFGFGDDDGSPFDDLWEWDGNTWTPAGSTPTSRTNYGAAYDSQRDRVMVFGGRDDCGSGSYLDETWEWNGGSWRQRFPALSPTPRERSRLTFDEARGRIVLFGGSDGASTFNDTWEWNGDDWIARLPTTSPPGSSGHGLSYDEVRRVTVAFGSGGTWDYGPTHPANIEPFGSGCPGSSGTPSLSPKPWAGPWLGGRLEVDIVNRPPGLGIFVWGFSETAWIGGPLPYSLVPLGAAPGCNLLVSDTITEIFLSGTNPYVSFVLPTDPSFVGARMRAQAGFLDIGLANAPVTSNALRMTFGSR